MTEPIKSRRENTTNLPRRTTRALWALAILLLPLIPGTIALEVGYSPFDAIWTTASTALAMGIAAIALAAR